MNSVNCVGLAPLVFTLLFFSSLVRLGPWVIEKIRLYFILTVYSNINAPHFFIQNTSTIPQIRKGVYNA
jgi:uncharacterized membrane protein